jgi:hypothetical protein
MEQFLDPAYRYRFTQGPDMVRNRDDALRNGINCVSLAHLAIEELTGQQLPDGLHCYEMFGDTEHTETVDPAMDLQPYDLIWFGLQESDGWANEFVPRYDANGALTNWRDNPLRHIGIHTGDIDESGDPLILHASPHEETNVVWPLREFAEHSRYRQIHRVARLHIVRNTLQLAPNGQ